MSQAQQLTFDFKEYFRLDEELLTPIEMARKLRISTKTLARKRLAGEIAFVEISPRTFRYPKQDGVEYLESRYRRNDWLN